MKKNAIQSIYNNLSEGKKYGYYHRGQFYEVLKLEKTNTNNKVIWYDVPDNFPFRGIEQYDIWNLKVIINRYFRITPKKFENRYVFARENEN